MSESSDQCKRLDARLAAETSIEALLVDMSRLSSESADLVEHFEDAVRRADRDLAGIDLAALELQIKAPWSPLDVVKLLIHVRDQVASARACLGEVIS